MTGSPDRAIADLPAVARRARTEAAAARRTRERHLRTIAASETSLGGALRGWSDRREVLRIEAVSGATYEGVVTLVGRDAIAVGATLMRWSAIVAVHAPGRAAVPAGPDGGPERPSFDALVGSLSATRPLVRIARPGLAPIEAELRSAGNDVLEGVAPGSTGSILLPLGQVSELTVLASG